MSPKQIARNMERVKKLRQHATDAFFAKSPAHRSIQDEADRLARVTAAALRQSDYWAPAIRDEFIAGLERH